MTEEKLNEMLDEEFDKLIINKINDVLLKEDLSNQAINALINANFFTSADKASLKVDFGYLVQENEKTVGMFKIILEDGKTFFVRVGYDKLDFLKITDEEYNNLVDSDKSWYSCTNDNLTDVQKDRKQKNNNYLKTQNIDGMDSIECIYYDNKVELKPLEEICKRLIASAFATQAISGIQTDQSALLIEMAIEYINKYGVHDNLNSDELAVLEGDSNPFSMNYVSMEYEAFWALCWCVGLVDDIKNASTTCAGDDVGNMIYSLYNESYVVDSSKEPIEIREKGDLFSSFVSRCKLRSVSEILDMLDLYYRYSCALNENKPVKLDQMVVKERRRALEWVISNKKDWFEVYLPMLDKNE